MKKIIKEIIGWILYVAFLLALVYGIPKGLAYVLKTDYPMASITSGSMWPALKRGDLILIKGVGGKEEIEIGDIVVYKNPQGFTIHRVIQMREDTFITKGDANNVQDNPVRYEELVGKPVTFNDKTFRIPLLGKINIFVNKL
jgi:signal peptidase